MAALRKQTTKIIRRINGKGANIMTNYFRITAFIPEKNISCIIDSFGAYEKLWQFSSFLIQKGCKIIAVGTDEKFLDGNISKLTEQSSKIVLRAIAEGEPIHFAYNFNGTAYQSLKVGDKEYYCLS